MIVLSSWELLIFTLFKSLTELNPHSVSAFKHMHYFESDLTLMDDVVDRLDDDEKVRRLLTQFKMDKNRMVVILLTRLLRRLILKATDAINQKASIYVQALDQFCWIASEFILEPVIFAGRVATESRHQNRDLIDKCISTPALEFLHCMIKLL